MKKEQDNKKKVNRWTDYSTTRLVSRSSEEEVRKLREESFKRLENFVKNGTKRKD